MVIIYLLKMQNKLDKLLLLLEDTCREEYKFTFNNPYCKQNDKFVKERENIRKEIHNLFSEMASSLTLNDKK